MIFVGEVKALRIGSNFDSPPQKPKEEMTFNMEKPLQLQHYNKCLRSWVDLEERFFSLVKAQQAKKKLVKERSLDEKAIRIIKRSDAIME